jgi:hypothetical protein
VFFASKEFLKTWALQHHVILKGEAENQKELLVSSPTSNGIIKSFLDFFS